MRRSLLSLVPLLAGCLTTPGPQLLHPRPEEAGKTIHGAWLMLHVVGRKDSVLADGELLAASAESLWVLTSAGVTAIPTQRIGGGQLVRYEPEVGEVWTFAALGAVSTLSHGLVLILSAPLWGLSGLGAASAQYDNGVVTMTPQTNFADLRAWARFPQGIPPGVDRAVLVGAPRR